MSWIEKIDSIEVTLYKRSGTNRGIGVEMERSLSKSAFGRRSQKNGASLSG